MKILKNNFSCIIIMLLISLFAHQSASAQQTDDKNAEIREVSMKISREKDPVENERLYQQMRETFSMDSTNRFYFMGAAASVSVSWLRQEDVKKYRQYAQIVYDNAQTGRDKYLLTVFVDEIIRGWAEEGKNLPLGKKIAWERFKEVDEPKEGNLGINDPAYFTSVNYANCAYTYAIVLHQLGELKESLQYAQKAAGIFNAGRDIDFINFYASILSANGYQKEAMEALTDNIKKGQYNENTMDRLKEVYVQVHGDLQGYADYQKSLEQAAYKAVYAETAENRIKDIKPVPAITLGSLKGGSVSLEQLKGKIVVIDFWATWCVPCIKSFPGMQTVIQQYKNNPDVVFLFINTKESEYAKTTNLTAKVKGFMDKRGYSFNVLLDKDNNAYEQFGIQGLPTRIVLDKQGMIRFRSAGFPGTNGMVVNETKAMIEFLINDSKP